MMRIDGGKVINAKQLTNAIVDAFKQWAQEDINDAHWDDQFRDDSKWLWDQETRRRNGETVFSPRDIYDLGELYESGRRTFRVDITINGASAYWHWDARNNKGEEYAIYVHDGTRFMDGRPFTNDIAIGSSFWRKTPGKAFKLRVQEHLKNLNAR